MRIREHAPIQTVDTSKTVCAVPAEVFDGTAEQCLDADIPRRCFRVGISGSRENGYAVMPIK